MHANEHRIIFAFLAGIGTGILFSLAIVAVL